MDSKDETILALQELLSDLTNKLIAVRVQAGLALKAKDAEIADLRAAIEKKSA